MTDTDNYILASDVWKSIEDLVDIALDYTGVESRMRTAVLAHKVAIYKLIANATSQPEPAPFHCDRCGKVLYRGLSSNFCQECNAPAPDAAEPVCATCKHHEPDGFGFLCMLEMGGAEIVYSSDCKGNNYSPRAPEPQQPVTMEQRAAYIFDGKTENGIIDAGYAAGVCRGRFDNSIRQWLAATKEVKSVNEIRIDALEAEMAALAEANKRLNEDNATLQENQAWLNLRAWAKTVP